jgi:pyruvate formate lyase activating enzyme
MERAVVANIQGYSVHDGPGIRTVVFLKGCPLRCDWCANPENLLPKPDIGFIETLCRACGKCLAACEFGAIRAGDAYRVDRDKCARCFKCLENCDCGALVRYGEEMTSGEVRDKVRRDKTFYDASGGGVTFSGGEPLLAADFVRETCEMLRGDDIESHIETCGFVPWSAFETVLPAVGRFLFDIKFIDAEAHARHTGAPNALILENARKLAERKAPVAFRRPLVPGVNDKDAETEATAAFLKEIGVPALELMPHHRLGQSKYEALRMRCGAAHIAAMAPAEADAVRDGYIALGIDCTVSR